MRFTGTRGHTSFFDFGFIRHASLETEGRGGWVPVAGDWAAQLVFPANFVSSHRATTPLLASGSQRTKSPVTKHADSPAWGSFPVTCQSGEPHGRQAPVCSEKGWSKRIGVLPFLSRQRRGVTVVRPISSSALSQIAVAEWETNGRQRPVGRTLKEPIRRRSEMKKQQPSCHQKRTPTPRNVDMSVPGSITSNFPMQYPVSRPSQSFSERALDIAL